MKRKAYFYVDDVIWVFRDIAREKPKSIFEQRLLKILKEMHDRFGFKATINCFYRTDYYYGDDEFTLEDMPDTYKAEWEANNDWLKIGYHAKQEFPDLPFINVEYDDMKNEYKRFEKEVKRFAGENILMETINPHWWPVSKDGCRALRDCGIKIFSCTYGVTREFEEDSQSLPYGHGERLLQNRKPESKIFYRQNADGTATPSLCGYNHLTEEETAKIHKTFKTIYNEELGIHFKKIGNGVCLNTSPIDLIEERLEKCVGSEYICCATHEEYTYPDYFAYQPDTRDKYIKMCETLEKHGYEYFFVDECLELQKEGQE